MLLSWVPELAALASLGDLLEKQILSTTPRLRRQGLASLQVILMTLKVENHHAVDVTAGTEWWHKRGQAYTGESWKKGLPEMEIPKRVWGIARQAVAVR